MVRALYYYRITLRCCIRTKNSQFSLPCPPVSVCNKSKTNAEEFTRHCIPIRRNANLDFNLNINTNDVARPGRKDCPRMGFLPCVYVD
jgi:hypothetical protein